MAGRTNRTFVGEILGGIDPEFAQPRGGIVGLVVIRRLKHPWKDAAVAAAGRAPAAGGIEGKVFGVEFGEGLAGFDVGARRGEPGENLARGCEQEAGAVAEAEGCVEGCIW